MQSTEQLARCRSSYRQLSVCVRQARNPRDLWPDRAWMLWLITVSPKVLSRDPNVSMKRQCKVQREGDPTAVQTNRGPRTAFAVAILVCAAGWKEVRSIFSAPKFPDMVGVCSQQIARAWNNRALRALRGSGRIIVIPKPSSHNKVPCQTLPPRLQRVSPRPVNSTSETTRQRDTRFGRSSPSITYLR